MKGLATLVFSSATLLGSDAYLFTSFRSNGETGVFAAVSSDGRQWVPALGGQAWIKPEKTGELMRDPWLGQGPDGVWHMLWTWGWGGDGTPLRLGHASSKDLERWSAQDEIRVFADEPNAQNAWAPEAVWDSARGEWVVFWATTVAPFQQGTPKQRNHRIFAIRTKDWKQFTKPELFFDPGYNTIDSTIVKDGDRYVMVFKDERNPPVGKRLRLAFAKSPQGPWTDVSEPWSGDWVEGPTAVKIGDLWWIYFDHYAKPQHYEAATTRDWKTFQDVTAQVQFPEGQRHGTVVRIPVEVAKRLAK